MRFKRRHSVPIVFLTSPRCRIRHVFFIYSSHRDTYFQFTISQWLLSLRSVLSVCHISINHLKWKWVAFFPAQKLQRVTFFMKRSYLLPRENFKLPYLPNQAHWDPGICSQMRSSHIHSIHQKSRDFINGNFVYLALSCAFWSSRGRAGKKVTAVTFFRCPTVIAKPYCMVCGSHFSTGDKRSGSNYIILCYSSPFVTRREELYHMW